MERLSPFGGGGQDTHHPPEGLGRSKVATSSRAPFSPGLPPSRPLTERAKRIVAGSTRQPGRRKGVSMPTPRPEDAIERAKQLRKQAKEAGNPTLGRALNQAADRLEANAAKAARRIGRPVRKQR